jgi:hypothetical protein
MARKPASDKVTYIHKDNLNQIVKYYQQTKDEKTGEAIYTWAVKPVIEYLFNHFTVEDLEIDDVARESFMKFIRYYNPDAGKSPFAYLTQTCKTQLWAVNQENTKQIVKNLCIEFVDNENQYAELVLDGWRRSGNKVVRNNPIISISDEAGLRYAHSFETTHYEDMELKSNEDYQHINYVLEKNLHKHPLWVQHATKEYAIMVADDKEPSEAAQIIIKSGKYSGLEYLGYRIRIQKDVIKLFTLILQEAYKHER